MTNNKLTLQQVKQYVEANGYKLISTEYIRAKDKLDMICPEGHNCCISYGNFSQGRRCNECAKVSRANSRRIPTEIIAKAFQDAGCELITKEFKNSTQKLQYRCSCGNISETTWSNFSRGKRCKSCGIEKVINKISGENNYRWIKDRTPEERKAILAERTCPEYKRWRKAVLKKDHNTCQCCHTKEGLEAHHIFNWAEYPHLRFQASNGITLCKNCHVSFHKQFGLTNNNVDQIKSYISEEAAKLIADEIEANKPEPVVQPVVEPQE